MKEVERQSERPDPRHFLNVDVQTCISANPNYQTVAHFTVQFQFMLKIFVVFLIENKEERGQYLGGKKANIYRAQN